MAKSEALCAQSAFPIGVAVDFEALVEGSIYKELVSKHFNSITAENIFKPNYLHPEIETFDFRKADALVGYCQFHKKRIHGHTLIWDQQTPPWLKTFCGNKNDWENILRVHVQQIVGHFAGRLDAWDVINEAFENDGTLRKDVWQKNLGDDYFDLAFKFAKEADTNALLFYNDYDLECNAIKRKGVLDFLETFRTKGTVIDGIGLQLHLNLDSPINLIKEAVDEITASGFKIHFSEIDISINTSTFNRKSKSEQFEKQAELLRELVLIYRSIPPELQYGMTFWGLSDNHSWRNEQNQNDQPLLFDSDYLPKPAFTSFYNTLK